jgi:hypothetical protein
MDDNNQGIPDVLTREMLLEFVAYTIAKADNRTILLPSDYLEAKNRVCVFAQVKKQNMLDNWTPHWMKRV